MNEASLSVDNLKVVYEKSEFCAIDGLTFEAESAQFVTFLGTSGCGKSTILNVLAGFIPPTSGTVLFNDKPIGTPSWERGMVFQNYSLFPWLTVEGNVEYGLKSRGLTPQIIQERTEEFINLVGLNGFAKAYPNELSGGMQQRVALARVLVNDPALLLMDEPFGALDAQTRMVMQELLLDIFSKHKKTVVFVTHDVDEAILLSDVVFVLTAAPASIKTKIEINIPRPRDHNTLTDTQFIQLKKEIMENINEETGKVLRRSVR